MGGASRVVIATSGGKRYPSRNTVWRLRMLSLSSIEYCESATFKIGEIQKTANVTMNRNSPIASSRPCRDILASPLI